MLGLSSVGPNLMILYSRITVRNRTVSVANTHLNRKMSYLAPLAYAA